MLPVGHVDSWNTNVWMHDQCDDQGKSHEKSVTHLKILRLSPGRNLIIRCFIAVCITPKSVLYSVILDGIIGKINKFPFHLGTLQVEHPDSPQNEALFQSFCFFGSYTSFLRPPC